MAEEIWKTINDYPNYDVSSFGNIRNNKTNKVLKPALNASGYYRCTLVNNLGNKTITIHKLVAICFIQNDSTEAWSTSSASSFVAGQHK